MKNFIFCAMISIASAANLDVDLFKFKINEIPNKGILGKSCKTLNNHGLQQTKKQIQEETLITPSEVNNDSTAQHSIEAGTNYIYSHETPSRTSKNQETLLNMGPVAFMTLASEKNSSHDAEIIKKEFRDHLRQHNCKK